MTEDPQIQNLRRICAETPEHEVTLETWGDTWPTPHLVLSMHDQIRSLQSQLALSQADLLAAKAGGEVEAMGNARGAELTAEQVMNRLQDGTRDCLVIVMINGVPVIGVGDGITVPVTDAGFASVGIRREVKYYDLQASPSPLSSASPIPTAENINQEVK